MDYATSIGTGYIVIGALVFTATKLSNAGNSTLPFDLALCYPYVLFKALVCRFKNQPQTFKLPFGSTIDMSYGE